MEKRWVQHISGSGPKHLVHDDDPQPDYWLTESPDNLIMYYCFPKSEYVLCEPPEVWRDVTDSIEVEGQRVTFPYPDAYTIFPQKYRLRKVTLFVSPDGNSSVFLKKQTAFIAEKLTT